MKMDDKLDVGRWVDDHLAARIPDDSWEPNVIRGLAQFRERRGVRGRPRRRVLWLAFATAAACLPLMALPATRAFAQRCVSACVTQSDNLREFFSGKGTGSAPRLVFAKAGDRKVAPDFLLNDAAGIPVRLSEFRGRVVLLSFWATWCVPCKTEIPWFVDFHHVYKDHGLVVLGVSLDEGGWNPVKAYLDEMKIDYRVMVADENIARLYGGLESIPVTLIIDKAGRIAVTHVGLCPRREYEDAIKTMLAE
jgi:cytochrome c biogenesis protein CcmG/thiol:disulfide interchange protein DsbE